jgi:hypothetical protein
MKNKERYTALGIGLLRRDMNNGEGGDLGEFVGGVGSDLVSAQT